MDRDKIIQELQAIRSIEVLSGRLLDADEDLGGNIYGCMLASESADHNDLFYAKSEMSVRLRFMAHDVSLHAPALNGCQEILAGPYSPGLLPYGEIPDHELLALHALAIGVTANGMSAPATGADETVLVHVSPNRMHVASEFVNILKYVLGHPTSIASKIMVEAHERGKALAEVEKLDLAWYHCSQLELYGMIVAVETLNGEKKSLLE